MDRGAWQATVHGATKESDNDRETEQRAHVRPASVFLSLSLGFLLGKTEFQVIHGLSLHF